MRSIESKLKITCHKKLSTAINRRVVCELSRECERGSKRSEEITKEKVFSILFPLRKKEYT